MTTMWPCKLCTRGVTFQADQICGACRRKLQAEKPTKEKPSDR